MFRRALPEELAISRYFADNTRKGRLTSFLTGPHNGLIRIISKVSIAVEDSGTLLSLGPLHSRWKHRIE